MAEQIRDKPAETALSFMVWYAKHWDAFRTAETAAIDDGRSPTPIDTEEIEHRLDALGLEEGASLMSALDRLHQIQTLKTPCEKELEEQWRQGYEAGFEDGVIDTDDYHNEQTAVLNINLLREKADAMLSGREKGQSNG